MFVADMNDKKTYFLKKFWCIKSRSFGGVSIMITALFMPLPVHSASCNIPKSYYKNVSCTSDSRYFLAVTDKGNPVALLNKQGKKTTDLFSYDQVLPQKMRSGLLPVRKNGKVGYVNARGVVAIPLTYDSLNGNNWARGFSNKLVVVKKSGKWGVINTANQTIVPFSSSISRISDYSGGQAEIVKSGVTLIVDTKGQTRHSHVTNETASVKSIQPQQHHTSRGNGTPKKMSGEVNLSESQIKALLVDYKLIPVPANLGQNGLTAEPLTQNKNTSSTTNNTAQINQPKHNNIIQTQAIKLIPKQNAEGKWGFDDENGVNMITYSFDAVMPFSNGLAGVKLANNWGFINKAGDLVINFRFNDEGVRSESNETYHDMPPFIFYGEKAWIGSLRTGKKLCIDKEGVNVTCDE